MNSTQLILTLATKDLRIQLRSRHALAMALLLSVMIVVVLALGLGTSRAVLNGGLGASSILWVAYLFGGVLLLERSMTLERDDDAIGALRLAPIDRGLIFWSKLAANLILITALTTLVTFVAIVLFALDLSAAPIGFAAITALGVVGFTALGTLLSAIPGARSNTGGLLALLVLPLSLPLVLMSNLVVQRITERGDPWTSWVGVLVACDVIYVGISRLLFGVLLDDQAG